MGEMREDMQVLKQVAKQNHDKRVAKTPDRIAYAIQMFEKMDIQYELKNAENGHFHVFRRSDRARYQFYASTGKIQGEDNKRGIHDMIKLARI